MFDSINAFHGFSKALLELKEIGGLAFRFIDVSKGLEPMEFSVFVFFGVYRVSTLGACISGKMMLAQIRSSVFGI